MLSDIIPTYISNFTKTVEKIHNTFEPNPTHLRDLSTIDQFWQLIGKVNAPVTEPHMYVLIINSYKVVYYVLSISNFNDSITVKQFFSNILITNFL